MFFDNLIHPKPPLYQKQTTNKKVRKFMITIKNYDSHLPISNYHLGDTHIFRIHNPNMKRLNKIKKTDFEPYINILNDTINTNKNLFENNNHYLNYTNSIGIIVDTYKSADRGYGSSRNENYSPDRSARAHQGVSISAFRNSYDNRRQRNHQFGYKGTLPYRSKEIPNDNLAS